MKTRGKGRGRRMEMRGEENGKERRDKGGRGERRGKRRERREARGEREGKGEEREKR